MTAGVICNIYTIASRCIHRIYYPRPRSEEVCGQIYPKPKARDIFHHKLPKTEVEGSISSEYTEETMVL